MSITRLRQPLRLMFFIAAISSLVKIGMLDQQAVAVLGRGIEQVLLGPDVAFQRHDHFFADRIDRRVGDLSKQLLEVVVDHPRLVAQTGDRTIVAHRADRVSQLRDQRTQHEVHGFGGVAESLHPRQQGLAVESMGFAFGMQVGQANSLFAQPISVRHRFGEGRFQLVIGNQATLFKVDQEHLAGLQASLFFDDGRIDRQHADFAGHDARDHRG